MVIMPDFGLVLNPVIAIDESGTATLTATIFNTDTSNTLTLDVDWGDPLSPDNVEQYTFSAGATGSQTFTLTHLYDFPNVPPQANYTISVGVTDDDRGLGTDSTPITVNPVNDSPEITVPGSVIVNEDSSVEIAGISVFDVDLTQPVLPPDNVLQVTLSVDHGTLVTSGRSARTLKMSDWFSMPVILSSPSGSPRSWPKRVPSGREARTR